MNNTNKLADNALGTNTIGANNALGTNTVGSKTNTVSVINA